MSSASTSSTSLSAHLPKSNSYYALDHKSMTLPSSLFNVCAWP